jgi:membrane-associated phospholipid phosphatase
MTSVASAFSFWVSWLKGLSPRQKAVPAVAILLYWTAIWLLGGFRADHFWMGVVILVLCYGGPWAHRLRPFMMPFLLTAVFYDSQRFYADLIRGPIHVTEPYEFDKRFFGITLEDGRRLTPNEWWQLHLHPVLDLITGFAYLVFFAAYIAISAYFYFWVSRKGTERLSPSMVLEKSRRIGWAFFWLNMLGYSTYYWYAASPPWYVSIYGLGPARTDVPANAAGCARFDEMLGTSFFSGMYGRAADVHGAIPSLHVSYPLLALIFALQFRRLRVFSLCFYLLMCFSAVYLNHHYVLDLIWGSAYAVLMFWIVDRYSDWQTARSGGPRPARSGAVP